MWRFFSVPFSLNRHHEQTCLSFQSRSNIPVHEYLYTKDVIFRYHFQLEWMLSVCRGGAEFCRGLQFFFRCSAARQGERMEIIHFAGIWKFHHPLVVIDNDCTIVGYLIFVAHQYKPREFREISQVLNRKPARYAWWEGLKFPSLMHPPPPR